MRSELLYTDWPYLALMIFLAAMLLRSLLFWRKPRSDSETISERSSRTDMLWRFGLSAILLGHTAVLLFPNRVLAWNTTTFRLYLLEGVAFATGLAALIGWAPLVWRHMTRSGAVLRDTADSVLLSLVGTTLVSGLLLAWMHRWASLWAASTLAPYLRSLISGSPQINLVSGMPFLVRIHVTFAFATLAVLPFSRAGVWLIQRAARPLLGSAGARIEQLRRGISARLVQLNLGQRLWPEED